MDAVEAHEKALTGYALEKLAEIPGRHRDRAARHGGPRGAVSFTVEGIHPHDVGQVLDDQGIAVRVGHHCAWPVVRRYGVPATTRATFYVHTGYDDIDALAGRIRAAQRSSGLCEGLMQLDSRCTRRSSWTTTRTRTAAACASRSRPRCTTSTRRAATR